VDGFAAYFFARPEGPDDESPDRFPVFSRNGLRRWSCEGSRDNASAFTRVRAERKILSNVLRRIKHKPCLVRPTSHCDVPMGQVA